MNRLLLTTAALLALSAPAFASNVFVTGYDTPDPEAFYAGTVNGYNYYDGPITLHVAGGPDLVVYCADLNHDLHSAEYTYSQLKFDGLGDPLSTATSSRIGGLADMGEAAFAHGQDALAAAVQLAIWSVEYNTAPTSFANATIESDFNKALSWTFADTGYARALTPVGDWPSDGSLSQQMVVGAPEPSTWAMGLLGFGALSLMGWKRSRKERLAVVV